MRFLSFFLLSLLITSMHAGFADQWVVRDGQAMGTTIHTEIWHQDQRLAEQVADEVINLMNHVDQLMSPYIESSELSLVNRQASQAPVQISDELFKVIERSIFYSELTHGAFDITYASIGYMYDFREAIRPSRNQLDSRVQYINYKNIVLDPSDNSVFFRDPNVRIDLGGIAKGFAVDLAIEKAARSGVENILVTAGGDSRILGDRAGRPWVIGIRHPMDKNRVIAKLPLADESLSTSGDYERYFDEDGVRYHHILDPKTGDSARDVRSVTILGPQAMDTDALSTSVFVMGPKKGLELLDRLPGIEGIIVDQNGNLLFSTGLQNLR